MLVDESAEDPLLESNKQGEGPRTTFINIYQLAFNERREILGNWTSLRC